MFTGVGKEVIAGGGVHRLETLQAATLSLVVVVVREPTRTGTRIGLEKSTTAASHVAVEWH